MQYNIAKRSKIAYATNFKNLASDNMILLVLRKNEVTISLS